MVQTATSFQPVISKLVRKNAAYNFWTSQRLINWLSTKGTDLMDENVASSFPSIRATLIHICNTERFWLDVLRETPLAFSPEDLEALSTENLFEIFQRQAEQLMLYIEQLSDQEILEEVSLNTPWVKGRSPRYEFIQHVVNHTTYHRGQIVTIGRNLGFTDAPMTDYNYFNMMPF
jgi:uncharacterized damage-inducible protein DinB